MKRLILLMALMSLFIVGIADAALTLQTTTWRNDTKINITFGTGDYVGNATHNLTIFASCSDTANSSTSKIYNITNTTATNFNEGSANFTFDSTLNLEDSTLCSVTGRTLGIGDADAKLLSAITVNMDRTAPSAPTTSHSAGTEFDDVNTKTISYTVIGTHTTSCRIAFMENGKAPRFTGTNTFAMTHSANTCTYTVTKATVPDGIYDTYVRASDGTNTSTSTKRDFKIKTMGGDSVDEDVGTVSVNIAEAVENNKQIATTGVIAVIVILGYYAFIKKK